MSDNMSDISQISTRSISPPGKTASTPKTKQAWQKAMRNVKLKQESPKVEETANDNETTSNTNRQVTADSTPRSKQDQGDSVVKNKQGDTTAKVKQGSGETTPTTPKSRAGRQMSWNTVTSKAKQGNAAEQNKKDCERKKSTTSETLALELETTLERVKQLEEDCERSNNRIQGLEAKTNRQYHESRSLRVDLRDKDDVIDSLSKEVSKRLSQIEDLKKDLKEANAKVRGVTNMEWKAMEYEKVNIMNENLKQKLETQHSENRDLERRLRERDKEISEKERQIEVQAEQIEELNDKMLDMRLQVREEAIKNSKLDEKLEDFEHVQQNLDQRDQEMSELTKKLEDMELLLQHAKKSWREEREKIKSYEDEKKEDQRLTEEMDLTTSENMTLKRLVIAKDTVLIHKSQALENIKNMLNNHDGDTIEVDTVRKVLQQKPVVKPTFPRGNKTKQEQYENSCNGAITNGWIEDVSDKKSSKRGDLFQAILGNESNKRMTHPSYTSRVINGRRPQTAVVKPHNYTASSFTNFRSSTEKFSNGALDTNRTSDSSVSMRKWNTTKDVRNDNDHTKHTLNGSNKLHHQKHHYKSQNDIEIESSKLRRSKSADNRIYPQDLDSRPTSPGSCSQKTMSVSTTLGSTGSGSVSAVMLKAAPQRDRKYSRVVRIGDRVVVDLSRSKEKRKTNYQPGMIKFIGNLDKEYDCYRIYIGVRLDDPNGDTDGLYKGKRYFKVTTSHGKFLRITKIVSVYNKETCKFEDIEALLVADDSGNHGDEPQNRQFELDI